MQYKLPFLVETPPATETPTPPHPAERQRRIVLGNRIVSYSFRRSKRRTIGIAIDERGLRATAPQRATLTEVESFLREKEAWILKHLQRVQTTRPPFRWQPGARLPLLGRELVLHCAPWRTHIEVVDDRLEVPLAADCEPQRLRELVIAWLRKTGLELYRSRIAALAPQLGIEPPPVGLSQARTQWGSCTRRADGSIRILLNWRLLHFELRLIDYVVAHELAHVLHMNHSAVFWQTVGRIYPDYEAARRALRERGHLIPEL